MPARAASPAPYGLLINLLAQPDLALLTDPSPRFSWIVPDGVQRAYRLIVATDQSAVQRGRGDQWDSGWVDSAQSLHVPYNGRPLASRRAYWWAIRTRNERNKETLWSAPQRFRTGELGAPSAPITDRTDMIAQSMDNGRTEHFWNDRHPTIVTEIAPERIVRLADNRYFADFGRAWFGTLRLTAPPDAPAAELTLHLGERLAAPDTIDRTPPGSVVYRKTGATLAPGKSVDAIIPPLPYHSRPVAVKLPAHRFDVAPFRAVEIENWPGSLKPENLRLLAVHTVFDDTAASFQSSEPGLDTVWELCRHTFKASSFLGVSIDGDRERTPYEADAYIAMLGHCSMDREWAFWRHTADFLFAHPTWPTEWALHMPFIADADYELTGDISWTKRHFDALLGKLLREKARPDGLLKAGAIVDWPPAERDGYNDGRRAFDHNNQVGPDVNTVVNAFVIHAREKMIRLAKALGRDTDADALAADSKKMRSAFQSVFFDPARGLYIDGEGSSHASMHANVFPLAFGLVPPEHVARVAEFVASKGMACSVYAAQYLMEALYAANRPNDAMKLLLSRDTRSWRHMIDMGATMTAEAWDKQFKPNLTFNHAWGAVPGNIIPRFVLGVTPTEPGYSRVQIAPQPGQLAWANGTLPTIRGPIKIAVDTRGNRFALTIETPGNVVADVRLPIQSPTRITHNGRPIDHAALTNLPPGKHTIVASA